MQAAKLLGASGGVDKLYVDDVFSAYTYTGNGSTQTITNGIDLAGKGGMVWIKERSSTGFSHRLWYTASGTSSTLHTHDVGGLGAEGGFTSFNSNGFTLNTTASNYTNYSGATFVGWTFRNADKFYNHTTVVKTGGSNATVSFANLTTLGMVRVKRTDSNGSWYIWHRSLTAGKLLIGETTAAEATLGHITVSGTTVTLVNGVIANGTYLVEGFAHDTGTDGLIQCGSYTGNASTTGPIINLGWEPQYVLVKASSASGNWTALDSMRALNETGIAYLRANTSAAEVTGSTAFFRPLATGFQPLSASDGDTNNPVGVTYIYLAIRRPNKPPTVGTQVYNAIARTGTGAAATVTGVGFAPDVCWAAQRDGASETGRWDRLRGGLQGLRFNTDPELAGTAGVNAFTMDGVSYVGTSGQLYSNTSGSTYINHFFKRAPGVMDVVCYTGTGSATTVAHGLGAVPELMIVKKRSATDAWYVYVGSLGATKELLLNMTLGEQSDGAALWNSAAPTSSVFSLGTDATVNQSTGTFVTYLFATLAGISKVGSYTGTATTNAINCGFTTGARFVMIKRTDSTGDWYVWDTTRGIIAGNDPYLLLNSTAAEVTGTDYIDPSTSGFELSSTAPAAINASGGTFIYLAFA